MFYFAYGSNLDWGQMRERCPSSRFVTVASLENYRLAFTRYSKSRDGGVADVIPEPGHGVWGVVYQIDEQDISCLDTCEGFRPGREREKNSYVREKRDVFQEGDSRRPLLVSLYFAVPQQNAPFDPHPNYMQLIIHGAKHWHLPGRYIQELEAIETRGSKVERRERTG